MSAAVLCPKCNERFEMRCPICHAPEGKKCQADIHAAIACTPCASTVAIDWHPKPYACVRLGPHNVHGDSATIGRGCEWHTSDDDGPPVLEWRNHNGPWRPTSDPKRTRIPI